jgi:Protein of unknown function (DUF2516)
MDLVGNLFTVLNIVTLVFVAFAVFAFVDALTRRAEVFVAAGKLTKPAWAVITGLSALVLFVFSALSFFGLPAMVATIVYFVDVRPAVRSMSGGGGGGNQGSYGSW